MKKETRRKILYHVVCVGLLFASVACAVFVFPQVLPRFIDGVLDVVDSVKLYGLNILTLATDEQLPPARVIEIPKNATALLPWTWEEFCEKMYLFGQAFIKTENVTGYLMSLTSILLIVSMVLVFLVPVILLLVVLGILESRKVNNDDNVDTLPLKVFKFIKRYTYDVVKRFVIGLVAFVKEYKGYLWALGVIWLYNLNFATIILETLAFVIYFVITFDIAHIYTQIAKLAMDLTVSLTTIPLWVLVIAGVLIFDKWRLDMAKFGRYVRENANAVFVKSLALIVLLVGTTGKKKTTLLADISKTKEVEFREQALTSLRKNALKFPAFPWINVERTLRRAEKCHAIYNLASIDRFVNLLRYTSKLKGDAVQYRRDCIRYLRKHYKYKFDNLTFDYNPKNGTTFDNSLYVEQLYDVIKAYMKEFYIYRFPSSIIAGNISIRSTILWDDAGNFPVMDADFFKRDSKNIKGESQYSHIADYDMFRLEKLYEANNPMAGAFEFGVVDFDEWAKDRGNQVTNAKYDKDDNEATPKNDGFNLDMKTRRQSALVDNDVYVFFIGTEQRASSMNADLLELCDIVDIEDFKLKLGIPLFSLEMLANELFKHLYDKFWGENRKLKANNTLFGYIVTNLYRTWWKWYLKRFNEFAYFQGALKRTLAGNSGKIENHTYFIQFKKTYADVFASDAFGDYYARKADRSSKGLNDVPTYGATRATMDELEQTHSYYVDTLNETFGCGKRQRRRQTTWQEDKKDALAETTAKALREQRRLETVSIQQKKQLEELQKEIAELREKEQTTEQTEQNQTK